MIKKSLLEKYYPPTVYDGTKMFYDWIRKYIDKDFIALNFGAGLTSDRKIKSLRGEIKAVYGVDVDSNILKNQDLDFPIHLQDQNLPFKDNSFDIVWSDYVLEHLNNPEDSFKEVYRVLKPEGSFFFRTPNKYHYVSLISNITPNWFHTLVANKIRELPENAHEPYKTYYRANSIKAIKSLVEKTGFKDLELKLIETEPSYLLFNQVTFYIGLIYERVVNQFNSLENIRATIFGRLTK